MPLLLYRFFCTAFNTVATRLSGSRRRAIDAEWRSSWFRVIGAVCAEGSSRILRVARGALANGRDAAGGEGNRRAGGAPAKAKEPCAAHRARTHAARGSPGKGHLRWVALLPTSPVTVPAVNEAMIPHPQPATGDEHTEGDVAPSLSPAVPPRCQARTRVYRDGQLVAEGFPPAEISEHLDADPAAVVWLDLLDPDTRDLAVVTEEFGLHPLAVEDATHDHQRPKLDRYESHLFTSMYAVSLDPGSGQLTTGEINAFITPRALITVRKTHFDVDTLLARWDVGRLPDGGVGSLVHGLLDAVVDGHIHAVAELAEAVDALEDCLFDPQPVIDIHRRGFQLRRTQVQLRRVVLPMRELLADLANEHSSSPLVTPTLAPYFQDVRDHVLRAADGIETARDVIASILETNYTEQSSQLNEITKKLAAWAAIIAVPTAVTGFYGQNVPYPGFSQHWGFLFSTAVILVLSGGLYVLLRRQRWL